MKIVLPNYIEEALSCLNGCGYEAYAVGGCVRDTLMGRVPHDWDLCSDARPQAVARCFPNQKVLKTGVRHGTVTVMMDHHPVEITTYRVDGQYTDHRRPDAVAFTSSLKEDLARRDFTINAMAYHPMTGLVDFFGGQEDIASQRIRCVGEPALRFGEDALRILRALRFATRFGFALDAATGEAILSQCDSLAYVAAERVFAELCGINFARFDLRYLPVLQVVMPELITLPPQKDLPEDPAIRWASLLRESDAVAILSRLKASRALTERVTTLVREYKSFVPTDPVAVRRLLCRIGPDAVRQLLLLQGNETALTLLDQVLARGDCYSLHMLAIDGLDLLRLGLRGKAVGETLQILLDQVIEGKLTNDAKSLLQYLSDKQL